MTSLPEHELVSGCRAGQRACQHELYRRYSRAMYGTCTRLCANREDAEDLLQTSFVDVFAKLEYFRGESTVGAWIKRIVINNCINHLKRRRLRLVELSDAHHAAEEPTTFDEYEMDDQVERIRGAVAELPDGYRAVLSLYLFEGFDHAEIAEVLAISEQTSKSQYSRGRRRLRELLQNQLP